MSIRALLTTFLLASLVLACTPGGATPIPTAMPDSFVADPTAAASSPVTPDPTSSPAPTAAPETTAGLTPTATATPDDSATPKPTKRPKPKPYAMNLATKADFVRQYTFEWCVGASIQMALNMVEDADRTGRADQADLWAMARDRSSSPFGGANPRGWTAALNDLGIGPYVLVSLPTLDEALHTAAEAIRATKRPVGLVMWRGRHAWVMSGFESTADPRTFDDFDVTGIRVHDPLYPHGSLTWGKSPKPNSLISPATLAKQYVARDQFRVNLGVAPGYLLVLPVRTLADAPIGAG